MRQRAAAWSGSGWAPVRAEQRGQEPHKEAEEKVGHEGGKPRPRW